MLFAVSGLEGCCGPGERRRDRRGQGLPVRRSDLEDSLDGGRRRSLAAWPRRCSSTRRRSLRSDAAAKASAPDDELAGERSQLTVNLTKSQIEAGPHAHEDDQVTRDMEGLLYDYYGSDPYWGASHFGGASCRMRNSRSSKTRRGATLTRSSLPSTAPIICTAWPSSRAITFTPWTATSAMSRTFSPTTPIGRSAISSSRRETGGRARSCSFRPMR